MHRAIATSFLLCLGVATAAVAADGGKKGGHPLFQTQDPLAVTLQAPWPAVLKPGAPPTRYPAVLGYTDAQGQAHRLAGTVETRGITRRQLCRFPPLRLRFDKGVTGGSEFAGQQSLKMVTHCDNAPSFRPYYVEELLAYRIYNLITERSFRARPLEVTYLDPKGGKPNGPRFAFLIEDVDDMAKRNGLEPDPKARFRPSDYDSMALSRFMLFQYLLGNTDWDVLSGPKADQCCHNVRVVAAPGATGGRIPVPYDFDSSGMIDAKYAAPHESLPIKDVRTRLYRGLCSHNDTLGAARREYQDKRAAILALVQGEERLDPRRREALATYLGDFYATLDDDARFAQEITAKCRR